MKQNAIVKEINGDGTVNVSVLRKSACSACSGRHVCGGSRETVTRVSDPFGVGVGATVVIEVPSSDVLKYSALVFLAPVLLGLTGYLALSALGELAAVIAAAVGFILPLAVAFVISRRKGESVRPVITEILPEGFDYDSCEDM